MPNTFKNKVFNGSSTAANTDMAVYTAPASCQTVIVGLTFANTGLSQITVDIKLFAPLPIFLAKNIPLPAGGSFEYMAGNKLIMETGHTLKLQCDTANSLDTVLSLMEIT